MKRLAVAVVALLLLWSCARIVIQVGTGHVTDDDFRVHKELGIDTVTNPKAEPEKSKP